MGQFEFRGPRQLPAAFAFPQLFPLRHPLHVVHHSALSHDNSELSGNGDGRRPILDRAPAVLAGAGCCNDPALRRRTVADGLRLCARRLRLLHGWPTHPRLGRRRLLALADRAGGGTVLWTDVARLVQRPAPEAKRYSHLRRDVADCTPVRWTTRRGFRTDFHTGARADLLEPHRTSCNHGFAVHRPAPAGLCTRRDRTLDRPSRGQCARDCAPRPFRAKPSQRAGLYRRLHDHRVRRDWRFIADAASAHPAGKTLSCGATRSPFTHNVEAAVPASSWYTFPIRAAPRP